MEIIKIFSDEYDEERLYSVLLSEEEYRVFADYSGLDSLEKSIYMNDRKKLAGGLRRVHNQILDPKTNYDRGDDFKGFEVNLKTGKKGRAGHYNSRYQEKLGYENVISNETAERYIREDHRLAALEQSKKFKRDDYGEDLMKNRAKDRAAEIRDKRAKRDQSLGVGKTGINPELQKRTEEYKARKAAASRGIMTEGSEISNLSGGSMSKAERKLRSQASIAQHVEKAKKLRRIKNLKRGGAVATGVGLAAGTVYGAKKLYDKKKNKK